MLGPDNAHIGDVVDVLFDKSGRVEAVVVGVGGFLGIGEKNVALDMSAFQVVPANINSSTNSTASSNDPNDIKLKVSWTKEQLKAAPDFQYFKTGGASGAVADNRAWLRGPRTRPRANGTQVWSTRQVRDGPAVHVGGPDCALRQFGPPIFLRAIERKPERI